MALPGVNTVIQDRFLTLSRRDIPLGPRVVIIGKRTTADNTADGNGTNVRDLDPYNASREDRVYTAFGVGSDLHRGYVEAVAGGASRITLIALPSDTAFDYNGGTIESATYTAAVGSNTLFDDAFSAAEAVQADIIVPWGRGADPDFEYEDPATPATEDPATPGFGETYFGFYADNSAGGPSFAKQVAQKCATITANSHPCFAVMGVKPYIGAAASDGGMTPAQVASHLTLPNLINRATSMQDANDNNIGIYLSIVVGEIQPVGYNDNYSWGYANGAATYAGTIAQLDSWSAPTGKAIFNVNRVRYNPTRSQQLAIVNKGCVPVALTFNRTPTWVDAQTFGKDTSDYARLTTLRIVFDAVQMVRQVAQQFIGEGSNLETRNALEAAITAGLRGMQQLGALNNSDFAITYIANENKAVIDLVLAPAFEIRNIEVSVSVQL